MPKPQYGAKHQAERAKVQHAVDAGQSTCHLCGRPIDAADAWDLDHEPGTTAYRGPTHARCNRVDGARRGNQQRSARWIF